jgi:hypothetical protein
MFTARKFLVFVAFAALCAGFTQQVKAEPIIAINNTNILIRFDSATPGVITTQAVTGLMGGTLSSELITARRTGCSMGWLSMQVVPAVSTQSTL